MKKKLNLLCLCVIAAFLLSVSGNVQMIVRIFINGFEIGMPVCHCGLSTFRFRKCPDDSPDIYQWI